MNAPLDPPDFDLGGLDLLDTLLEGVVVHAADGRIVLVNEAAARMLRTPREVMLSRGMAQDEWILVARSGRPMPAVAFPAARVLGGEPQVTAELIGFRAHDDQRTDWFRVSAVARTIRGSRHVVVTFTENSHPYGFRFRDVVDSSHDMVLVTDADRGPGGPRIVYANPAFSRVTGYSLEEAIGRSPRFLQGEDTAEGARRQIREALRCGQPVRTTIINYARNGRPYWLDLQIAPLRDSSGLISHFVAIQRDMSDSQPPLEQALHAAGLDPLTGLLNRRGFLVGAELLHRRARREHVFSAMLVIDIDGFREISERFGHAEADRLLGALAALARRRLRESDLFGHLDGEGFAILASVASAADGAVLANSLRQLLGEGLRVGTDAEPVTVSIGVHSGDGSERLPDLLGMAQQQLGQAKRAGGDRIALQARAEQTER